MWYRRKQHSPRLLPGFVALEFQLPVSKSLNRLNSWLCIGFLFSILNSSPLPWFWRLLLGLLAVMLWPHRSTLQVRHVAWIDSERWQLTLVSGQQVSAQLTARAIALGPVLLLCWQSREPARLRYWYAYVHETEMAPAIFRALKGRLNC
jgi:hypothetical protein